VLAEFLREGAFKAPTERQVRDVVTARIEALSVLEPPPDEWHRKRLVETIVGDVRTYMSKQFSDLKDAGRTIFANELPFGIYPHDASSRGFSRTQDVEVEFGGVRYQLHGSIDRIDIRPKEGTTDVVLARIVDYKTGNPENWWSSTHRKEDRLSGNIVQLVLYALALEKSGTVGKARIEVEAVELHSPQSQFDFAALEDVKIGLPGTSERQAMLEKLARGIGSIQQTAQAGVLPRNVKLKGRYDCGDYCPVQWCCPNRSLLVALQKFKAASDGRVKPYFAAHAPDVLGIKTVAPPAPSAKSTRAPRKGGKTSGK
jgi:hypothetical protein